MTRAGRGRQHEAAFRQVVPAFALIQINRCAMPPIRLPLLSAFLIAAPLMAAEPKPEIARPIGTPQQIGVAHTIRQIPEACARFEGAFTGDAAQPYRMSVVRTSAQCQPRARLLDYTQARPDPAKGWKLNDIIRVPNAACPKQQAVVRVWRMPVDVQPPALDAQQRSRIYLKDAQAKIQSGTLAQAPLPTYAVQMVMEGERCQ